MNKEEKLIVISGWGSISPLGLSYSDISYNSCSNKSLLCKKSFNNKEYSVGSLQKAEQEYLKEFAKTDKNLKRIDKSVLMAIVASQEAIKSAGWHSTDLENCGISAGSSRGATELFEQFHSEFIKDSKTGLLASPLTTLGQISSAIAYYTGATGFAISHSMTCSTAHQAITNAIAWIKAGICNRFIAGGSEAPLTPFTLAQLEALGIYSKDTSSYPCRPLTAESSPQNTMTLGEGSAMFTIEAKHREELKPTDIIIESVGFGSEFIPSLTGMTDEGLALQKSMSMAISQIPEDKEIDLIITHTPGTVKGDAAEISAINSVFNNYMPAIYANKWKIGHTYGASGALSIVSAIIALREHAILTLPYNTKVEQATKAPKRVMVNAAGFGGNASSIVLSLSK